ncbi:MAG: hypothetical protein AAF663_00070 [Planctomycetota bacterium]
MPSPSPSKTLATLRPDLGGSFMEFDLEANMNGFIGLSVFTPIEVDYPADTFGRVKMSSLLKQVPNTERAPGSTYARDRFEFEDDSYKTRDNGVEYPIDDRNNRAHRNYINAELAAARKGRNTVLTAHESRVSAALAASTNTTGVVGGAWSAVATCKPLDDVDAAIAAMWDRGIIANTLVISWKLYRFLRRASQLTVRLEQTNQAQPSVIRDTQLAELFDLDQVLIAGGRKLGSTASSVRGLWSDTEAYVTRVDNSIDIEEPCVGRTLHYSDDGSALGGVIEEYRDESRRSNMIRTRMDTDEKTLFPEAIQKITGVNP